MNALVPIQSNNAEVYRASTDAAGLCREIVLQTAMAIQGRKYVKVEGWQAIAIAHGCTASARDVEAVTGGVRAIGEIRRMSDGALIAQAEGFVGEDEPTWFGGEVVTKWGKKQLPKRPDYAIRAMAQTRSISRACRSAFAHVVVLIDANLSTTPAEEVPMGGFEDVIDVAHEDVTPKSGALVGAAKAAIDITETAAEADAWRQNNAPMLAKMEAEDIDAYNAIAKHYKAHVKTIKARTPASAKAAFPGDFSDVSDDDAAALNGARP